MPTYTVRQQQVLEFVRATLEERGIAPTLEEIATDLGGISRVSEQFLGVENSSFLLRVRGSSMIEDHICDGDLVLVESRTTARDGETVVAVVGEEVTLKRFRRQEDRIRLEPANAALAPMIFPSADVQIRGVVRGVIRRT
jgi:repressor LexA